MEWQLVNCLGLTLLKCKVILFGTYVDLLLSKFNCLTGGVWADLWSQVFIVEIFSGFLYYSLLEHLFYDQQRITVL